MPKPVFNKPRTLLAGFYAGDPDPDLPELVHAGEQWAPGDFQIPEHSHAVWEFYLQMEGGSEWRGLGRRYHLEPGAFFAAPPGVLHDLVGVPSAKFHFYFAALDLEPILARLPELAPAWEGREIRCVAAGASAVPAFRQLIREITTALPHRTAALRLAMDALVLEATRLIADQGALSSPPKNLINLHPAVVRAREVLDREPEKNWRLAELARVTGLSATHLAECFTREMGLSPHQYLLTARLERAKEALRGTDVPITTLALDLGFSSSQHFAAAFRKHAGVTPRDWRRG
jgi:AraC-like DNA-binding protein